MKVIALVNMGSGGDQHQRAGPRQRRSSGATSPSAATSSPRLCSASSTSPSTRQRRSSAAKQRRPLRSAVEAQPRSSSPCRARWPAEIQKTFDFFGATSTEGAVDEIVVSGGCALTPGLVENLRERFGVGVEVMDPFRRVQFKESDFDGEWLRQIGPMMAVSVGLAVRKLGD